MEAKKIKIFINCDEAAFICDKTQYKEATLWERIRLQIRLLYCGITKSYVKKNTQLTNLVTDKTVSCMDKTAKESLKISMQKRLQDHP